jgi:hypothetical protein
MAIMINDTCRYATAAANRALGLAVRAETLADEIDALHRDIRAAVIPATIGANLARGLGHGPIGAPWSAPGPR